jgi:hypothetical protein
MTYENDEPLGEDDAVPADMSPDEDEDRPDWLLDAAVDPINDRQGAPGAPRLTPGVPPPKPKPPAPPAPRVAPSITPPERSERSAIPIEEITGPLPEPDTFQARAASTHEAPPAPPEPSGPVAWTAAASSVPVVRSRHRHAAEEPPAFEEEKEESADLPELREHDGEEPHRPKSSTPPPSAMPSEPFWLIAFDELRTNRKIQIGIAVAAVLLVVIVNQPWKDRGLRLAKVLANAATLDGQPVRVSGRVGDIFQVGGGYAYYLHDGKDSIVVFTRATRPQKKARLQVYGTVSTGFLDGAPRAAIFETPDPTKS